MPGNLPHTASQSLPQRLTIRLPLSPASMPRMARFNCRRSGSLFDPLQIVVLTFYRSVSIAAAAAHCSTWLLGAICALFVCFNYRRSGSLFDPKKPASKKPATKVSITAVAAHCSTVKGELRKGTNRFNYRRSGSLFDSAQCSPSWISVSVSITAVAAHCSTSREGFCRKEARCFNCRRSGSLFDKYTVTPSELLSFNCRRSGSLFDCDGFWFLGPGSLVSIAAVAAHCSTDRANHQGVFALMFQLPP